MQQQRLYRLVVEVHARARFYLRASVLLRATEDGGVGEEEKEEEEEEEEEDEGGENPPLFARRPPARPLAGLLRQAALPVRQSESDRQRDELTPFDSCCVLLARLLLIELNDQKLDRRNK
jgi:hypothetical protein